MQSDLCGGAGGNFTSHAALRLARDRAAAGREAATSGAFDVGLRTKFNLVILAAFVVGFAFAAFVGNRTFVASAREEVLQQARVIMTAANAVRDYTATELEPLLPKERANKFVPQTVPAYAAQKSFNAVQAQFAGLAID